jgi:hypothetical protein
MIRWTVEPEWTGETCYIIGGGPSVLKTDTTNLPGRIIATNEAGLTVRPDADVLFFADLRWWEWNKDRMHLYTGPRIVTNNLMNNSPDRVHYLNRYRGNQNLGLPLSEDPTRLSGWCSGGRCINLAFLLGAREIVLIGFDMHEKDGDNFHNMHKSPPLKGRKAERFIPSIEAFLPGLNKHGVNVVNCTPGSALTCFPIMSLEEYHANPRK